MDIRRAFRKYLKETGDTGFTGWEKAEFYCEDSLVDAWKKARPQDYYKFYDREFAMFVEQASGKWLERHDETEPIKVLISTRCSGEEQVRILAHELRHACDHARAVDGTPFKWPRKTTEFWYKWSEYRATKTDVEVEYYQELKALKGEVGDLERLTVMGGIYGRRSVVYMANLMRRHAYRGEQMYFLTRFLAVQRKLKELMERDMEGVIPVFAAWDITPAFICREYGDLTELCDLWDSADTFPLETTAPCFTRLWRRVGRRCRKLAEELRREEEEAERREKEAFEDEVCRRMEEIRGGIQHSPLMEAMLGYMRREGRWEEAEEMEEELLRNLAEYDVKLEREWGQMAEEPREYPPVEWEEDVYEAFGYDPELDIEFFDEELPELAEDEADELPFH